jgi:hypothetical protein
MRYKRIQKKIPPLAWMFVSCVVSKEEEKGKTQNNQDKEPSTDEVQITREYGNSRVKSRFFSLVRTDPGAHPASYTMGTGSLSRG